MEKQGIIAIILTFLIILGWSLFQSKFYPPPAKEARKEQAAPLEQELHGNKEARELKETLTHQPKPGEAVKQVERKEISVETEHYWAVFTNEKAELKHFKLKKYKDRVKESPITFKIKAFVDRLLGNRVEELKAPEPLDLVDTNEREGLPLGLTLINPQTGFEAGNWEADKENLTLARADGTGELTFRKNLENGLKVLKRFRFHSADYVVDIDVEIQNPTDREATLQPGLDWTGKIELAKIAEGNKDFGLKYSFLKNEKVNRNDSEQPPEVASRAADRRGRRSSPSNLQKEGTSNGFHLAGSIFLRC